MTTKYLLRCDCGNEIAVEPTQAGEQVACICGKQVDVPTMRRIKQLPQASQEQASSRPAFQWGLRHALVLIGIVLVLACAGFGHRIYRTWPQPLQVESFSLRDAWMVWAELRGGVDRPLGGDQVAYNDSLKSHRIWAGVVMVTAGIGVAFAVAGLAWPAPKRSGK